MMWIYTNLFKVYGSCISFPGKSVFEREGRLEQKGRRIAQEYIEPPENNK